MADAFAAAHRSKSLFVAGILFLAVTALDLAVAVTTHSRMFAAAGALSFAAGVLLLVASQRQQKSGAQTPSE